MYLQIMVQIRQFRQSLELHLKLTKRSLLTFKYADALKDYIDLMVKYSPDADKPEALVGVDYDSAMGGSFCIGKTAVIQMGQWVAPVIDEIDPELREKHWRSSNAFKGSGRR